MAYFDGVKVGDWLWEARIGDVKVIAVHSEYPIPLISLNCNLRFTFEGRSTEEGPRSLFWCDPHIIPPPRPKRKVKKTLWVRVSIHSLTTNGGHDTTLAYPDKTALSEPSGYQIVPIEIEVDE